MGVVSDVFVFSRSIKKERNEIGKKIRNKRVFRQARVRVRG